MLPSVPCERLDPVSKRHTFAELTQVLRELGMKQSMFNWNTWGPEDKRFIGSRQDTILNNVPSTSFMSSPAILAPYVGPPVYEMTSMEASLEEAWKK